MNYDSVKKMDNFLRTLRAIRRRIEANIPNIEKYKYNKVVLVEIKSTLEEEMTNFTVNWDEFYQYLTIIENEIPEAKAEKGAQVVLKKALEEKVELSVCIINTLLTAPDNAEEETESSISGSRRSSRSSISSRSKAISDAVIEKKVKAETARARLQYVEEAERLKKEQYELELSVKKRRSEMESNLNILKCKQEIVESEAELIAVEEMLNENFSVKGVAVKSLSSISKKSKSEIVNDYLNTLPAGPDSKSKTQQDTVQLRPSAPEFVPQTTANFANYMVKKDLLLSRVTKFSDRPEQFYTWKSSFRNICTEIETNDTEELDLLLKYLGPESSRQANSIRNANPHDVHGALEKIWERLDLRFGAPEQVADSLRRRVDAFQKIGNEKEKLYDLADLIEEINSVKSNSKYSGSMSFYDSSLGVNSILCKLPLFVQNKCVDHCSNYKIKNNVMYPPFQVFVDFVRKMAVRQNDPSFNLHALGKPETTKVTEKSVRSGSRSGVYSRKTNAHSDNDKSKNSTEPHCVLHGQNSRHELRDCKSFLQKSIQEKREIVKKQGLCFKCMTYKHLASECKVPVKCEKCNKSSHCTAFHIDTETLKNQGGETPRSSEHGGEPKNQVSPRCTEICGSVIGGKSCAKTILVSVYPEDERHKAVQCYAVIDDQSNRTLGKSEIFDLFSNSYTCVQENFTLSTCAGSVETVGRRMSGLVIESHDNTCVLKCPPVLECNDIPDNKGEIATPNIARLYPHLKDIAYLVPEFCPEAEILLLIGRDMSEAHHVLDQKVGNNSEPYAQQLRLGWSIIGETCIGKVHQSNTVNVNKISVLYNGRSTILQPCENVINVKESDVFTRTPDDDTVGMSQEDKQFVKIMDNSMKKMSNGHLSAPLPFKERRHRLPSNFEQAKHRTETLVKQLKNNTAKCEQFVEFMGKMFENNHAELAPSVAQGDEVWYLPIFGVYHPKKPNKIRVVFDSAAKYQGLSLNDVLLTGPDLTNNLAGVLTNFRREKYAAMADVEQMFFNFEVNEEHRDFLRFLWFHENDISKPLVEYRMRVHVFGNSPSPAVATYGMRKSVCSHDMKSEECDEVCRYVRQNFYVDDGLVSKTDENELVDLIRETQNRLQAGGSIRLHKIVSNSPRVLSSFPQTDLAKDITEIDFTAETPFIQKSLGMSWDVVKDNFTYNVNLERKPYTKRGLLSTINGLFDPLGFVAPVVLGGRIIMKQAVQNQTLDWDDPLPERLLKEWTDWQDSLKALDDLEVPRMLTSMSFEKGAKRELHVYSDASKEAISAVAYVRTVDSEGKSEMGFVQGKSKLAPSHGHTIPRLELCAAVIATELAASIQKVLNISQKDIFFYTDSQVVLGYINNTSRRFYVYVANRVDKILKLSSRDQWSHVTTDKNPADHGTRPVKSDKMQECKWLKGPELSDTDIDLNFQLVEPEQDCEVRPLVENKKVQVGKASLGTDRFAKFSSWDRLVSAFALLKQKAASLGTDKQTEKSRVEYKTESEVQILKEIQYEMYSEEIECLKEGKQIKRNSNIVKLSPVLDSNGLLRVKGRLTNSTFDVNEKTPLIIPGTSHIATLLVRHYHEKVAHQGRHLTEGAIRSAGYWITSGKRLINRIIHDCVRCRRLRRPVETQKMADLPTCRVTESAPFTYVGVDTFGPWSVVTRKTRGGASNSKRWAILFSCLYTRAVHIEVVEDMTASCFINAMRRFISVRGPVKEFFSDRGTNFVGGTAELGIYQIYVEDLHSFLDKNGCVWNFSTPQSSHMNGAWERMIGLARRILESLLCDTKGLTHEVLCTLMAEVMCIINSRPITAVSDDPSSPSVLSPNMLLTHKENSDIVPRKDLSVKDMYRSQWRQVQVLADQFWKRWKNQYLQNLQTRPKWQNERTNVKIGDVVLLVDDNLPRIQWLVGVVDNVFPSSDDFVRKVSVRVVKDDTNVRYMRPITKIVQLLSQ